MRLLLVVLVAGGMLGGLAASVGAEVNPPPDPPGWAAAFAACATRVGYAGEPLSRFALNVLLVRQTAPEADSPQTAGDAAWEAEYARITGQGYANGGWATLRVLRSCMGLLASVPVSSPAATACAGSAAWWAATKQRIALVNAEMVPTGVSAGGYAGLYLSYTRLVGYARDQAASSPPEAAWALNQTIVRTIQADANVLYDEELAAVGQQPVPVADVQQASADVAQANALIGSFLAECQLGGG